MRIRFTKMQGAGNDFVVLDETKGSFGLTLAQYRWLADRHFGVGADQILTVRPAPDAAADFEYIIHNADGEEVEQCGNGARCFARFVHEQGLTDQTTIRVSTRAGIITPQLSADGRVMVDMGPPRWLPHDIPFDPSGLAAGQVAAAAQWLVPTETTPGAIEQVPLSVVSMGNPHAVIRVEDVDSAPVATWGPVLERHARFPRRVNVGFMQVLQRDRIRLRVFERGAGETLACGTGACAAVVAGIRSGWLDARVDVETRGGVLTIAWLDGDIACSGSGAVQMTGPATTVFHGEVVVPVLPCA